MPKNSPVCRCDKGYFNDKDGKCVGRFVLNNNKIIYQIATMPIHVQKFLSTCRP